MHSLGESERILLLGLARAGVEAASRHERPASPNLAVLTPGLLEPAAAFVTLREHGDLRGCIGMLTYDRPLWQNVRDSAVAAARDDPRFRPVQPEELPRLEIEISVLEPPRRIADPAEFVAGRHGIIIEQGLCRGLLLPQVATEMGWSEAEMLSGVCRKAGLPLHAWQDRASRLYVFDSYCFGESEPVPEALPDARA